MLDELISQVERLQSEGAVVLLKWDGERSSDHCTVVVTRQDTNFVWRKDGEDISLALAEALLQYKARHGR